MWFARSAKSLITLSDGGTLVFWKSSLTAFHSARKSRWSVVELATCRNRFAAGDDISACAASAAYCSGPVPLASRGWIRPPVCRVTRAPSAPARWIIACRPALRVIVDAADSLPFRLLIEAERRDLLIHVLRVNVERRLLRRRIVPEKSSSVLTSGKTGNVDITLHFAGRKLRRARPILKVFVCAWRVEAEVLQ